MKNILIIRNHIFTALLFVQCLTGVSYGSEKPLIFPVPKDVQINQGTFTIDKSTFIALPEKNTKNDKWLANLLFNEFVDKYELPIVIKTETVFNDKERFILVGDISNPLVRTFCEKKGLLTELKELGPEGYILSVSANNVVVASNTYKGALFGFESLRQIIDRKEGHLFFPQLVVRDSPQFPFRGIKLYLPGRENITFFKRFIKDFVALYKYNTVILELNANMRLERHPELNTGATEFYRYLNQNRLDRPPGKNMEFQNSSHQDNADGGILEKEEVADLVSYMRKFSIEVIPEIPSLTHSYYLLSGHRELAENLAQPFPDTYCPLKPEIYKIYFDVLDEYIDVIHPSVIHIGHDEWRVEKNLCDLCRGKDYGQLFADDVIKIHDYLAKKGILTAIWGDHLLESVTHKDHQEWESSTGYKYNIPGALTPEQVMKLIPKDILVFNWFWNDQKNDEQISGFGFNQVYGNFTPDITNWDNRVKTKGLTGGVPSSWAATSESNFGKDLIYDFLGSADLLWSGHKFMPSSLAIVTELMISDIRNSFRGEMPPSQQYGQLVNIDISSRCNSSLSKGIDSINCSDLVSGNVSTGDISFGIKLDCPGGKAIVVSSAKSEKKDNSVSDIKIDKDVNSIIFLHACAKSSKNEKAYRMIYNQKETAQLLGWYEVIYEDGFIETIPVRYGVNILDWGWKQRMVAPLNKEDEEIQRYVYEADAVECSKTNKYPVTFFSFEWKNTRPGVKVKTINLKSVSNTRDGNAIILLAVSVTESNALSHAEGSENE
jgi:hypothetical protein